MTKKPINEISKKLAGRYVQRVAGTEADRGEKYGQKSAQIDAARQAAGAAGWHDDDDTRAAANAMGHAAYKAGKALDKTHSRKSWNRQMGVHNAIKRLTKESVVESVIDEDVASIEEAIDARLRAYIDEALFGGPNDDEEEEDDAPEGDDEDDLEEEVEQVDELSIDAMKRYHAKSKESEKSLKDGAVGQKFNKNNFNKYINRRNGQEKAVRLAGKKVLAGEEAEQIDELSRKTLKSYMKKSKTSGERAWRRADKEEDKSMSTDGTKYPEKQKRHMDNASREIDLWRKRDSGQQLAAKKLKLKEGSDE